MSLIVVSSLVAFAVGELLLRRLQPYPQPQFLVVDPLVGHRHRPMIDGFFAREGLSHVHTNQHGLRDKAYSTTRNDAKRIAVLGDSYTAALQIDLDKTYHGLLEREFGGRLEVLNFGVDGYGTAQELLTYRYFVRPFKPDIVVLAFYPGNDLKDNVKALSGGYPRPYFTVQANGALRLDNGFVRAARQRRKQWVYDLYYFLTDHSIVFSLLDQLRYRRTTTAKVAGGKLVPARAKAESDLLYAPNSAIHRQAWCVTERLIIQLATEVWQDGAEFVLFVQDSLPRQATTIDNRWQVEQRLAQLCRQHGLVCSFMGPAAMAVYRRSGETLHGFDGTGSGHWNREGHRLAYAVVRNTLIVNHLLP